MHHKFCLIDDRILINGSYNWSYPARRNEENILVLRRDLASSEDERVFFAFRVKHNYFCDRGGIQLVDKTALSAYRVNPKDLALIQSTMDEAEIKLRQELENRIRESFDRARALKIPISQYLLERMQTDGGGVEFVRRILHDEMTSGEMKSGFRKLEEFIPHKVELSLEYLVSRTEFQSLFMEEERVFCTGLMKKYDLLPA
jgi:phosphatidylserine/phosphatidylglycerophosphate/cardiolipin synthase-like enzyme